MSVIALLLGAVLVACGGGSGSDGNGSGSGTGSGSRQHHPESLHHRG